MLNCGGFVDDSARGVSDFSHFAKVNPDITQQVVFCTEAWHFVNRPLWSSTRTHKLERAKDDERCVYVVIYSIFYLYICILYTGPTFFAGQKFGAGVSHVTFPCTQGHATERRLAGQDTTGKWTGSMHRVCQHKTYVQLDWSVGECAACAVLLSCEKEHSAIHLENIKHASKKVQGHLEQSRRNDRYWP